MTTYVPNPQPGVCPGCGRCQYCGQSYGPTYPYQVIPPFPIYSINTNNTNPVAGWRNGISASPSGAVPGSTPGPVTSPHYDVPGKYSCSGGND